MEISNIMNSKIVQAVASEKQSVDANVQVKMLSEAIEMQGEVVEKILSDIGNSIDIYV